MKLSDLTAGDIEKLPAGVQLAISVIKKHEGAAEPPTPPVSAPSQTVPPPPTKPTVAIVKSASGTGVTSDEWSRIVTAARKAREKGQTEEQAIEAFLGTTEGAKALEEYKRSQTRGAVTKAEAGRSAVNHGLDIMVKQLRADRHDLSVPEAYAYLLEHDERARFLYGSEPKPSAMP
jgi:hypothetical protein